jgi:hypothetical protein
MESKKYSLREYVSYLFLMVLFTATTWLLGKNDHQLLKYWFPIVMIGLLALRIPDFMTKKYHHFLSEMCYYVNIIAIIILINGYDIRYVIPFLHGPLLSYAIFSGDAFVPNDLPRTTSFAIHALGTVISRRLYWSGDAKLWLDMNDLISGSFVYYFAVSFLIYLIWFVPYSCYVFWYKGESLTMLRYTLKLHVSEEVSKSTKLRYLFGHMFGTMFSIVLGVILMHNWLLDDIFVGAQILSGFVQGAYYYYSGGKKIKLFRSKQQ